MYLLDDPVNFVSPTYYTFLYKMGSKFNTIFYFTVFNCVSFNNKQLILINLNQFSFLIYYIFGLFLCKYTYKDDGFPTRECGTGKIPI